MPADSARTVWDRMGLWLPALFLVFGLLTTIALVFQTERVIKKERQTHWEAEANRVRTDLLLHVSRHIDALRGYQAEFFAHLHFSEEAFQRVADALRIEDRLPGIDTIGYIRQRAALVSTPAHVIEIIYSHGHSDEIPLLISGLDFDPFREDAIFRARDSGGLAATAPVKPLGEGRTSEVILAFLPLYEGGTVPDTLEERHRGFVGVVFLALQPDRLMQAAFPESGPQAPHIRLLFDGYADAGRPDARDGVIFEHPTNKAVSTHYHRLELPVALAGTKWILDIGMPSQQAQSQRWLPWAVLITGMLLSALTASIIALLQSARWRSQDLADADRSLRREAESALLLRERAIEASANAIVIASATEPGYPVEYVNPAFERMTGYSASEVLGESLRLMHGADTQQEGLEELQRILKEKTEGQATLRNYRKDGQLYWTRIHIAPVRDAHGEVSHFVAAKYDITQMRRYQETLEFQAWHDELTLLPNRHALRARLRKVIESAKPEGPPFWVAFLDLDNFKLMNDSVGHSQGDAAIQQIAARLKEALHGEDMVARRGGDEFVFILFDDAPPRNGLATLQRIMTTVARPLILGPQRFHPSCSVGVAVYPEHGNEPELLIKHADIAMYSAKRLGRNNYQFFSPALHEQAMERVTLEADLRLALELGQFELHYQPQLGVKDGRISGMEALVRWRHPTRGLISPSQFIPVAEETGLIIPLGEWILRTACAQAASWQAAGMPPIRVAVNLSARQFQDQQLPSLIECILQDTTLDPRCLELELTESLLADDVEAANRVLKMLKEIGVKLSLDDFGTGYSSMAQLKHFPLDILKIDRSFVSDIGSDHSGGTIVRTIIKLAHSLDLIALAEGVETPEQRAFLQAHGCDTMQGYLIGRPLPAKQFEEWIRQHTACENGAIFPSSPVA